MLPPEPLINSGMQQFLFPGEFSPDVLQVGDIALETRHGLSRRTKVLQDLAGSAPSVR
jgi:hypothetical protein